MSYKVVSTTSQGCECGMFTRLWVNVCATLGMKVINKNAGSNEVFLPQLVHQLTFIISVS